MISAVFGFIERVIRLALHAGLWASLFVLVFGDEGVRNIEVLMGAAVMYMGVLGYKIDDLKAELDGSAESRRIRKYLRSGDF